MYGGEEGNAIVVDVGHDSVKVGYAGDDAPKHVFPSSVGRLNGALSADEFAAPKAGLEATSVFEDGLVSDWEGYEALWAHALARRLRVTALDAPLMVSEPAHAAGKHREKTVELLFEKHAPPALFLAKSSVLSAFAVGRATALVVDCGAGGTSVAAVHDGYALSRCLNRSPVGGHVLTDVLAASLAAAGTPVRPRFSFARAEKGGTLYAQPVATPGVTPSYTRLKTWEVAADVKIAACRVWESAWTGGGGSHAPLTDYELPDGRVVTLADLRYSVPELLFNPSGLGAFPSAMDEGAASFAPGGLAASLAPHASSFRGIPAAVAEVISKADVDVRKELWGGVVLVGGGSLFPHLKERLEREIAAAAPAVLKSKLLASTNSVERRSAAWIGGSILASLGTFQQMWMSKAEYEEHGANLVHTKCP